MNYEMYPVFPVAHFGNIQSPGDLFQPNEKSPSCLKKLVDEIVTGCDAFYRPAITRYGFPLDQNELMIDNSVRSCLRITLTGRSLDYDHFGYHTQVFEYFSPLVNKYRASLQSLSLNLLPGSGDFYGYANHIHTENNDQRPSPFTGKIFFDKACNPIDITKTTGYKKACGAGMFHFKFYSTPISLLFGVSREDIAKDYRIVKFKLSPGEDGFTEWKASESAPLLAYDPQHSGIIDSYEQLFGNWTFGGKSKNDHGKEKEPWKDGYEALGTLDLNLDGKLSETELSSLVLWFDKNRDAISDPGEVVSLREMGITALFYKNTELDLKNNETFLSIGYERVVNGETQVGTSVDWYGAVGNSVNEILHKRHSSEALNTPNSKPDPLIDNNNSLKPLKENVESDPGFAGTWVWKSTSQSKSISEAGVYVINPIENELYFGVSTYNLLLEENSKVNFSSIVAFMYIHGKLVHNNEQQNTLIMSQSGEDGTEWRITARLSEDKSTLVGETKAYESESESAKMIAEYKWTASRYK